MMKAPSREGRRGEDAQKPPVRQNFPKCEETIIHLMIRYPEVIPKISKEGILLEFENPLLKKMAQGLEVSYEKRGKLDLAEALGSFEEDLRKELSAFALQELDLGEERGRRCSGTASREFEKGGSSKIGEHCSEGSRRQRRTQVKRTWRLFCGNARSLPRRRAASEKRRVTGIRDKGRG